MDRSNDTYNKIKGNITFEGNLQYIHRRGKKTCIGCLVKSKYNDGSDYIEFYLFEHRTSQGPFACLNMIEYERAESIDEERKDRSLMRSFGKGFRPNKYFELIPRHDRSKEEFATELDYNRTTWIKELNRAIKSSHVNKNYEEGSAVHSPYNGSQARFYDNNLIKKSDDSESTQSSSDPTIIPRNNNEHHPHRTSDQTHSLSSSRSPPSGFIRELDSHLVLRKNRELSDEEVVCEKPFDEVHKILFNINESGVYAVSPRTKPEPDSQWALRVFENDQTDISSWNIYTKAGQSNPYSLSSQLDIGPRFATRAQLCTFYTVNDLPTRNDVVKRLTKPFSRR